MEAKRGVFAIAQLLTEVDLLGSAYFMLITYIHNPLGVH